MSKCTVVLGSQWGDEGKGKLVDVLCQEMDVCARFNGGNNAGHSIKVDGVTYAFHLLPSGMINPSCVNVIGNGVVVHVGSLFDELKAFEASAKTSVTPERLLVSDRAHVVLDAHQFIDGAAELEKGASAIGTTKKGIGPAYATKANRIGVRICDLLDEAERDAALKKVHKALREQFGALKRPSDANVTIEDADELKAFAEFAERLRPHVCDTVAYVHGALRANKRVLLEGANATMLDLDFGTYPFVTSSNPSMGGVCSGLGVNHTQIGDVFGVVKAYTTRVGAGPFPTEQLNSVGEHFQTVGHEFGTTTGRKRRCGWLDLVVVRYTHLLNGYTALNITKLDVLSGLDKIQLGVAYELDGKRREDAMPARLKDLDNVKVIYEEMQGWTEDISKCKSYDALPAAARAYVERIETLVGVAVRWIGNGAGRLDMIEKK